MEYSGTITFPNRVSEDFWQEMLNTHQLSQTIRVEMISPVTGNTVSVEDPPNLLAIHTDSSGGKQGVIRCSRMFFDGGVSDNAEISFQGDGDEFRAKLKAISKSVKGELIFEGG